MQLRFIAVLAIIVYCTMATPAPTAMVTYSLDLSVPNEFKIFAEASTGDNGGISTYSVPLSGPILTLDHRTPNAIDAGNFLPAGFNTLRTPDSGKNVFASQGLQVTANTIYGFGQEASSFAAKGITPVGSSDPSSEVTWSKSLLLATGTYDGTQGTVAFVRSNDLLANLFAANGSSDKIKAVIQLNPAPPNLPPEVNNRNLGSVKLGRTISTTLPHSDLDNDPLQWALNSFTGPGGATVPGASVHPTTGLFNWNSTGAALGPYSAVISASDGHGSDSGQLSFELVSNLPPIVNNRNLGNIIRGSIVSSILPYTNPDNDPLQWSLSSFNGPLGAVGGASVNPVSGQFNWNSASAPLGPYSAVLSASDGADSDAGELSFKLVESPGGSQNPTVTFNLDLTGAPGTFTLTAQTSGGDNGGIVSYGIPLSGPITSLDHRSPYAVSSANFAPTGFSNLRSADGVSNIFAGQPLSGPEANFLYGIGQTSGSFAGLGIPLAGSPDPSSDSAWSAPIVIATGTYNPALGKISFLPPTPDLFANVFAVPGVSNQRIAAIILTQHLDAGGGFLPEPSTLSIVALASIGFATRARRQGLHRARHVRRSI